MYNFGKRLKCVSMAEAIGVPETSKRTGVSRPLIHRWCKQLNILPLPKKGGRKRLKNIPSLKEGYSKSTSSRHRTVLLAVFKHKCYDCKEEDKTGVKLQQHLAYDLFPPQVLILCKQCHLKRHMGEK